MYICVAVHRSVNAENKVLFCVYVWSKAILIRIEFKAICKCSRAKMHFLPLRLLWCLESQNDERRTKKTKFVSHCFCFAAAEVRKKITAGQEKHLKKICGVFFCIINPKSQIRFFFSYQNKTNKKIDRVCICVQ